MIERTLSTFSKTILGVLIIVVIGGVVTAGAAVSAEKQFNRVKGITYTATDISPQNIIEGAYWELQDISTMVDSIEGRYTLITDIMENLPVYGAAYYYSFTANAVLSFFPLDDPSYAIDLWQKNISKEYSIIKDFIPLLQSEREKYNTDKPKWSARFKEICSTLGIPTPSVAVTGYDWFEFAGIGTPMPSSNNLTIQYVDKEKLDLAYGNSAVLHYNRIKALPQRIAPVTLYFQSKLFYIKNHEKIGESEWAISDEEIDAHFRKTFKSKKI